MKKRILCLLLSVCLILGICPTALAQGGSLPFQDVPSDSWFEDSIAYVYENNLMTGTEATAFQPNDTLTRGMFVTILGRMAGVDAGTYSGSAFTDVKSDAYYAPYIQWAASEELVNGIGGGLFSPDTPVTREQMVTIIARYVSAYNLYLPATAEPVSAFLDEDQVSDYAKEGVELARVSGLIQGDAGNFLPHDTASRAQAATIFMRLDQTVNLDPKAYGGSPKTGGTGSAPESYSVTELLVEGGTVSATVCTDQPCVLVIQFLSEDGETELFTIATRVAGGLGMDPVLTKLSGELPEHFLAVAVLRDNSGNDLSNTLLDRQYTQAYEEFMALTPEDERFEGMTVLDFDGDNSNNAVQTDNFGVLADGVEQISTRTLTILDDGQTCTYTATETPDTGDILHLVGADGVSAMIKVGTVQKNSDGTVTVTQDDSACMEDFYEVLKLSAASVDVGSSQAVAGARNTDRIDTSDAELELINLEFSTKDFVDILNKNGSKDTSGLLDMLDLLITLKISFEVEIRYDKHLFGPDYLYTKVQQTCDFKAALQLTGKISDENIAKLLNIPELALEFAPETAPVYLGTSGVSFVAGPFVLDLDFEFEGGGSVNFQYQHTTGTITETGQEDQKIDKGGKPVVSMDMEAEFRIAFGPDFRAHLGFAKDVLRLTGGVAFLYVLEAEMAEDVASVSSSSPDTESQHACTICLEGTIQVEAKLHAALGYRLTEKLQKDFLELDFDAIKIPIGEFYISVLHPDNNLDWGPEPQFGWDACPNITYRVTVSTVDTKGEPVSGVPVTISGDHMDDIHTTAPCTVYLADGMYSFQADFDTGSVTEKARVAGDPRSVLIQEPSGMLSGTVRNGETGEIINGATVTVCQSGMVVATGTTAGGMYVIRDLPLGAYEVKADAVGFKDSDWESAEVTNTAGTDTHNFTLTQTSDWLEAYAEFLRKNLNKNNTFQLIYVDGDDVPELLVGPKSTYHGSSGTFYTYYQGEVTALGQVGEYSTLVYVPKENLWTNGWMNQGISTCTFLEIRDGNGVEIATFTTYSGSYSKDGVDISQMEYETALAAIKDGKTFKSVSSEMGTPITTANIQQMLNDPASVTKE